MKIKFKSIIEISFVILTGFIANYLTKKYNMDFFLIAHLVFLVVAVFIRSVISNWKLTDYGVSLKNITDQIFIGFLLLIVIFTYYTFLSLFIPLIPDSEKIGAQIFDITTKEELLQKITKVALIKAGTVESLRYFSYIQGLLMQAFGNSLGGFVTFIYFGSSHMGIMNLVTLPVSCAFVYFYRTYKLIIPVIVVHILADSMSFTGMYLNYQGYYLFNVILFVIILVLLFVFRYRIRMLLRDIAGKVKDDYIWIWKNKYKAIVIALILPIWLHLLLYIEKMI